MKFLLLICVDPSTDVTPEESSPEAWVEEMDSRGIRLQGHALRPASEGRAVRVRDGRVLVGDGPFAETKEQMGGFDILECASLEEAVEVAARHPAAKFGTVEVREFADGVTGARAEVEIVVPRSPDEMWALVTDVSRIGEWSPECTYGAWLDSPPGPRVGARFEGRNRFGVTLSVTCVVTESEPPHRFAWVVLDQAGRHGSLWSYDLAPHAGGTLVRHAFEHGPGMTGPRAAVERDPGNVAAIVDERLAQLRANMTATIKAMTGM
ncbi:SRPBCC family protein [Nonomuraea cavernae]|uniref:SRPBCC family protein n=1 Tax=Nonomuraea cavernae TaxID=2045107 RepID=UPI003409DC32